MSITVKNLILPPVTGIPAPPMGNFLSNFVQAVQTGYGNLTTAINALLPLLANSTSLLALPVTIVTATPYSAIATDVFLLLTVSGNVYLPAAKGTGRTLIVKNGSAGGSTLLPSTSSPSDTIDGASSLTLAALGSSTGTSVALTDAKAGQWYVW